jgi:ubiquinone/menaquinone biosynthesis C-methylase UbiE
VAGVDHSNEMIAQATARNEDAIKARRVDLRLGFAGSLPFEDNVFDKALAINSMQIWPDVAGLRAMERVTKEGGIIALGFTPYSGQPKDRLPEILTIAGLTNARVVESEEGFCALAVNP